MIFCLWENLIFYRTPWTFRRLPLHTAVLKDYVWLQKAKFYFHKAAIVCVCLLTIYLQAEISFVTSAGGVIF